VRLSSGTVGRNVYNILGDKQDILLIQFAKEPCSLELVGNLQRIDRLQMQEETLIETKLYVNYKQCFEKIG
jgi:hypothetical protein